jgi:hypothetical protein
MVSRESRYWFLSLSLLILTIIAKIFFLNGAVFDLDYGLFHPDGMLYSFKTLTYLGHSESAAGAEVSRFYLENAVGSPQISPESLFFSNNSNWQIFQLRILYPLLSTPFVYVFGLWGMLAIPVLCFVTFWLFVSVKLRNRYILAFVTLLILSTSSTISRWMFSNISDPLLVGLFTLYVWLQPKLNQLSKWANLILTSFFIVATGLTRFSLLIWCAIAVFYLFKRNYFLFFGIGAVSFLTFLPNLLVSFSGAILPAHANSPWYEKLLILPIQLVKMHFVEFGQLFILDRVFFFGLIFSLFLAVVNFRNETSWLLILVFLSLVLTAGINGVLGVNFRYHLPVLPFIVAYLANYLGDFRTLRK